MPVKSWTEDMDKKFLLAFIRDKETISRAECERLAEAVGGGLTWNAARQKFYKLKKESEALLTGAAGAPAPPSTPASAKSAKSTKSTNGAGSKSTTGKRGRKKNGEANGAAGDDDGVDGTPSKKMKKGVVKKEPGEEDDGVSAGRANGDADPNGNGEDDFADDEDGDTGEGALAEETG